VDPSRLSYVGLGNSHMLYPDPKNRQESEANRRVEIKVTGT
jgi:flagellar motor protein MotB